MKTRARRGVACPTSVSRSLAVIVLAILTLSTASSASAQGVLSETWYRIETEHFLLFYHEGTEAIAAETAVMLEQAHDLLVPVLAHEPANRTRVMLWDPTDSANGSARVIPYNFITLQSMPPEQNSTLGYYDNWMWNLIVHEYTHVLHIDTMSRLFRWLNTPLGKQFAPNQALPRWFIEGLAVYYESSRTDTGRANYSLYRTYIREAALSGTIPDLGALSGSPTYWPQATSWYLVGAFFIQWIMETRGEAAVTEFIGRYGNRLIPYGINVTAERELGEPLVDLFDEWVSREQGRAVAESLVTRIRGETDFEWVTDSGQSTRALAVDASRGEILYLEAGADRQSRVENGCLHADVVRTESNGDFDVIPGTNSIVLSQSNVVDTAYNRRDLFELNLETKRLERLTWGARAREPRVSPDGSSVVYVAPAEGRTDLWLYDMESGESRILMQAEAWGQIAKPVFMPDGESVVFSYLREGHGRDIWHLDLITEQARPLTDGGGYDLDPWPAPDGDWVLFASDRDGLTFDFYRVEVATGWVERLTRFDGAGYSPVLVPEGDRHALYFIGYGPLGFDVARLSTPYEALTPMPAPSPSEPTRPGRPETVGADARDAATVEAELDVARYRALSRLRPNTWSPTIGLAAGQELIGATTELSDPVGMHFVAASLNYDVDRDAPVFALAWNTSAFPIGVSLSAARTFVDRTRSYFAGSEFVPFVEEVWSARFGVTVPVPAFGSGHTVSAAYTFQENTAFDLEEVEPSPEDLAPVDPTFGRFDSASLNWYWSDTERYANSISTERGAVLSLGLRVRSPQLGADVESGELTYGARGYIPVVPRRHHVLALRYAGGFGASNLTGRRLFGLGGPGPQDILLALSNSNPAGTANVRGYPQNVRVGNRYYLVNAEYRMPLFDLDAGIDTLPVFFQRLYFVGFADLGDAYSELIRPRDMLVSVGGELRLSTVLGYFDVASFRLGLARGLSRDGETSVYLLYGFSY